MYEYKAEVARVIDGDTVEVVIDLGFRVSLRETIRLIGINAPEMRTEEGRKSKAFLESFFIAQDRKILLRSEKAPKQEKYGRWLGELIKEGQSINKLMVAMGYAVEASY